MTEPARLDADLLRREFPLPPLPEDGDKEDRGLVLVIGGSPEVPGAAILSGIAAQRAGAGKLQIVTDPEIAIPVGVVATGARVIAGFEGCGERAASAAAVILGPGMERGPCHDTLGEILSAGAETPLVLDAAALGCLSEHCDRVRQWPGGAALLPHSREMAQLLGCEAEEVEIDPLHAARRAAERYHAVALIKGRFSFIVAPDGRAFRFEGGGIGLATSGSGDVLAGIVGGIAARGADPLTAVLWGSWLHGQAGRLLAERFGPVGFLAQDISDVIPEVLASV